MKRVVVLGGGIGSLSTGWMLSRRGGYDVTVVEISENIGGVCGSFRHGDFILDYGPHKFYSIIPGVLDELKTLMGDELLVHRKRNSIFLFGSFLKYPFTMLDLAGKMGFSNMMKSGFSMAAGMVKKHGSASYEDYIVSKFGRKLYELVFEPLADKTWGEPSTISADIARARIPGSSFFDVLLRMTGLKKETKTTDARYFYYPRRGFGRIPERISEEVKKHGGRIMTGCSPLKLEGGGNYIKSVSVMTGQGVEVIPCDLLVSSIPPVSLVSLLSCENYPVLGDAMKSAKKLQYRTAFLVYLFLNKKRVTDQHWIFFPGRDIVFGRVFEQKMMSPDMCPGDRTVLCCDFTDFAGGEFCRKTDKELSDRCINDLEKVGIIKRAWVEECLVKRLPDFYPRYDLSYKNTTGALYNSFKKFDNLLLTGRTGFYNYNNADHCIDMGMFIADNLSAGKPTRSVLEELEQRVTDYRIVD